MKYLLISIVIFLIELFIALYVKDDFIRPFFGDFLAVILVYTGLRVFFSNWLKVAFVSLILSYLIELLQYFRFVHIAGLSRYKVLSVILGTSFSWWDMVAYTAGFLFVIAWESELFEKRVLNP